jgi:hypothetical protein
MDIRIEIEGDSEEAIALALLQMIVRAEGREEGGARRDWILDTYRKCLAVVQGQGWEEEDEEDEELDEEEEEEEDEEDKPSRGSR